MERVSAVVRELSRFSKLSSLCAQTHTHTNIQRYTHYTHSSVYTDMHSHCPPSTHTHTPNWPPPPNSKHPHHNPPPHTIPQTTPPPTPLPPSPHMHKKSHFKTKHTHIHTHTHTHTRTHRACWSASNTTINMQNSQYMKRQPAFHSVSIL